MNVRIAVIKSGRGNDFMSWWFFFVVLYRVDGNCWYSLFRQLIYNYPEQLFADAGVMAIEHADFEGVERLALVLGRLLHKLTAILRYEKDILAFICKVYTLSDSSI